MSHVDFVVAFGVVILTISLIFSFLSSTFTNQFSVLKESEVKVSSLTLEKQLLSPSGILFSKIGEVSCKFENTGNYSRVEEINLNFTPQVESIRVYDNFFNEIPSTHSNINGKTELKFSISLEAYEKKYVNIYLKGNLSNIEFSRPSDMSIVLVYRDDFEVVSQEKCNSLKSYPELKDEIGFLHNFFLNITNCTYGLRPPQAGNIIVKKYPILFETLNFSLIPTEARLLVW